MVLPINVPIYFGGSCFGFFSRARGRALRVILKNKEPDKKYTHSLVNQRLPENCLGVLLVPWFSYYFGFNCKCPDNAPWSRPIFVVGAFFEMCSPRRAGKKTHTTGRTNVLDLIDCTMV